MMEPIRNSDAAHEVNGPNATISDVVLYYRGVSYHSVLAVFGLPERRAVGW